MHERLFIGLPNFNAFSNIEVFFGFEYWFPDKKVSDQIENSV